MSITPTVTVLRKRADFVAITKLGKKFVSPGLILQARASYPEIYKNTIRFGLTASTKIGNAVVRNRARRRLRSLVMSVLKKHALPGHDYVLVARVTTASRNFPDLLHDLTSGLKRLSLWHE